jgi:hypothetical protein
MNFLWLQEAVTAMLWMAFWTIPYDPKSLEPDDVVQWLKAQ